MLINFYLAAYFVCPHALPIVQQLNHLAHWITLAGVVGLEIAIIFRRHPLLWLWLLPGTIMFGLWYGEAFMPKSHATPEGTEISVMTYNTLQSNWEADKTLAVIREMDADIVALEETSPWLRVAIRRHLSEEYPYQAFFMMQSFEINGILSRYPILEQEIPPRDFTIVDRDEPRYLRAVLDVDGQRVVVYVFHPFRPRFDFLTRYDDRLNRMNYEMLLERLEDERDPLLVLCDCNTTPRTDQYGWMKDRLENIQDTVGWGLGLTHPGLPYTWIPIRNVRLDYIWYSREFTAVEAWVGDNRGGSDHHPLFGRLVLRDKMAN